MMPDATIRKIFFRVKPPPRATIAQQSHSHTRARIESPAILVVFISREISEKN